MATPSQPLNNAPNRAETNLQNAQHSTGPRTEAGKARVRTNALKHGLTAKFVFLAEEESERYEALLAKFLEIYQPSEPAEHEIVLELRDVMWRLQSIPVLEINLATLATEEHMEACQHLAENPAAQRALAQAAGYRANARIFDQFSRHEMRLQRRAGQIEAHLRAIAEAKQTQATQKAKVEAALRQQREAEIERLKANARYQEEQVLAWMAEQEAAEKAQTKQSHPAPNRAPASSSGRPQHPQQNANPERKS